MTHFPDPPIGSARLGLGILRSELNRSILDALDKRAMSSADLKEWLVLASGSALHAHLGELLELGVLHKHQYPGVPRRVSYELTVSGRELVALLRLVEVWFLRHPDRPLEPASPVGWRAFAALADAWESSLFQRLAPAARSESELVEAIAGLSDEKLGRELQRLIGAGVLCPVADPPGECRYALTDWGRLAISVLAAIARWERVHLPRRAAPITLFDTTVAFLATLPLLRDGLPQDGICVFTTELEPDAPPGARSGALWAWVEDGGVRACAAGRPPRPPDTWVRGTVDAWIAAILDAKPGSIQVGGDEQIAAGLLLGLHAELYASPVHAA